jgi:dTDP-4-amino-4,6-dideoxygalactose transaminase
MSHIMIEYENLGKVNKPFFEDFHRSFLSTLESGWYVLGNNVTVFESDFSEYIGVNYGIGVANGLDALLLALMALNLKPGDEVIVPSNTYIATIIAIIRAGLIPIMVEPDLRTYNIDPSQIEQNISNKTRVIIVVHLYGKTCEMDPILAICKQYNLKLLEDCAQSHGAMYKGKKAGSFGDLGCFSFYPSKNLGALGDAGAILCNSKDLADKVKQLRNYGSSQKYHNDVIGYNSRLDEVQAGFLSVKLRALNEITSHKRVLAGLYLQYLDNRFIKPVVSNDYFDVYHIFNIRYSNRDKLRAYLLDNGIQTEIHYPIAPHSQVAMKNIFTGKYPISEEIHRTTLSLPVSFFHSKEDILKVCAVMNEFILKKA